MKKIELKNCDFLSKIDLFAFPPWTNMYVVLPFVAKVSTYKTHCFFLQNVSVWHPQKLELLARRSIEVWEVALYVFFERDAIFLECSKANFDKFWKDFNIKFWCHTLTHGTVLRRLPHRHREWPPLTLSYPGMGDGALSDPLLSVIVYFF